MQPAFLKNRSDLPPAMISILADELVVCSNWSAALKRRHAKNPGRSGTSNSLRSQLRKNARDEWIVTRPTRGAQTSSKRDVAMANDSIYRIADMCAVARAASDLP